MFDISEGRSEGGALGLMWFFRNVMIGLIVIAAFLTILGLATGARAEDDWNHSGVYAGLTAGYNSAQLSTPGTDYAKTGAAGGAYIGYGIVGKSGLYVGLEADAMAKDIKWSSADGYSATASGQWLGSARLRVGQTWGPVLAYVTGGAAFGDQRLTVAGAGASNDWRYGWTAGGGIEAQLSKVMALRVEVLRYDFADKAATLSSGLLTDKIGDVETIGRVGISFKLN